MQFLTTTRTNFKSVFDKPNPFKGPPRDNKLFIDQILVFGKDFLYETGGRESNSVKELVFSSKANNKIIYAEELYVNQQVRQGDVSSEEKNLNICPTEYSHSCLLSVKEKSKQETQNINPKKMA